MSGTRLLGQMEPTTTQIVGSPVPIRTLNKSDITGVRLQALALVVETMASIDTWGEAMEQADIVVQWALRPATEAEDAASSGS